MKNSVNPNRAPASAKGDATRNQILDACEILFARNGYLGTSLRDIASEAGVRIGVLHYHYGNKHLILEAALDRKLGLLRETIAASFTDAEEGAECVELEEIVSSFILPFMQAAASVDSPLRNYIVMTSHLMSAYRMPELRPILAKLGVISEMLTDRIHRHRPGISERNLLAGVYLIEAALIFMVQDPGFLDDLSDNHYSVDRLEEMAAPALCFFTGGLECLERLEV
ncbi:TetR family transcriptional regulator [Sphingomonas sp. LH128]|uniref:TetR/AcrR family transcriptional regulator n=1 Tax=Sphingomonas sp. LH128 TaxID=473781 RepID=UPI00027CB925|nr:TetR/AcrR family transcriptional regulator [Sphingomonas sp. LH128]EJU09107.1 TetR family transcriptional regulator [Sphingomonas sp. LH128]